MSTTQYTATSRTTTGARPHDPSSSRADHVYDELQRALVAGEVHPDARLTEPKVSAYFGTSRTPVREALHQLHMSGLLRRCEFGYAPVRPTLSGIRDLYELRLAIELAGIDRAIYNHDVRHDVAALTIERDRWISLKNSLPEHHPRFVLDDEKFHAVLLSAAGNPELVAALDSITIRIRHVRMHDFMVNMRIETTIAEHLTIIEALISDDLDTAKTALRQHIGESLDVVIARVHRAIAAIDDADYIHTEIGRAFR